VLPKRWPPSRKELERAYLVERLSASKIAARYGLTSRYKTPKVAESTVLYWLKKQGIKRRDPTEHVRKVTEEMVGEWVRRYEGGESLKQIAGNEVSAVTVWNHLKERGVDLRDKINAQIQAVTKYDRKSFGGDEIERAYLVGFTKGDCHVTRHGRAIRVRTATTHPAMASLFAELFGSYGHVQRYPRQSKLVGYEWSLEVDLSQSFDFLLLGFVDAVKDYGRSPAKFLSFLAGFFDAEGSIYYHRKGKGGSFELAISNTNEAVLDWIRILIGKLGYYSKLDTFNQKEDRLGYSLEGKISRLVIWRRVDVLRVLRILRIKHGEKVERARAAICLPYFSFQSR
jgi:hypothetical protein